MGWCSATSIMDTTLKAAEEAIRSAGAYELSRKTGPEADIEVDRLLSPFVAIVAGVLRDGDWDCIEESEYFDRFQQEMLGHGDGEHLAWLVEQIEDYADDGMVDQVADYSARLVAFRELKGL